MGATYQFPFMPSPVDASTAFPNGRIAHRPFLPVTLRVVATKQSVTTFALCDTGADHCTFPLSFTSNLGVDPATLAFELTSGFGGSQPTFFQDVEITVAWPGLQPFSFMASAGFSAGMNAHGHGVLGQNGFFSQHRVTFDCAAKTFTVVIP